MPREHRYIESYGKEILKLRKQGLTRSEIGEKIGFTKNQIKNFISRYNQKQKKIAADISIHKKGRPPKNYVVTNEEKVSELRDLLCKNQSIEDGKGSDAGFSYAHRKEVRTYLKFMVIYRRRDKYTISEMCRFFRYPKVVTMTM